MYMSSLELVVKVLSTSSLGQFLLHQLYLEHQYVCIVIHIYLTNILYFLYKSHFKKNNIVFSSTTIYGKNGHFDNYGAFLSLLIQNQPHIHNKLHFYNNTSNIYWYYFFISLTEKFSMFIIYNAFCMEIQILVYSVVFYQQNMFT